MSQDRPNFGVSEERRAAAERARNAAIAEGIPTSLFAILGGNGLLLTLLPPFVSIPIIIAEVVIFADGLSNTRRRDKLLNPGVADDQVNLYRTPVHEFVHKTIFRRGRTA